MLMCKFILDCMYISVEKLEKYGLEEFIINL